MRHRYLPAVFHAAAVLSVLAPLPLAHAQNAPPSAAPPASNPTLAEALAHIGTPPRGVLLAVEADKIPLPKSAEPAGQAATPAEIAAEYGLITQDFGAVSALAPAAQRVLNADPADPNPFLDMEKNELLTLLSSTLTEAQWQAMTGPNGVALSDLTSADQKHILAALFPAAGLRVQPAPAGSMQEMLEGIAAQKSGKPYVPPGLRDVSGDLPRARLRLGRKTTFMLPTVQGGADSYSGGGDTTPGVHYSVFSDAEANAFLPPHPENTLYGIQLAEEAPNTLKAAALDYEAPALRAKVPISNMKTVGALVARISAATHVEMYADPHLAGKTLTILGESQPVPASDLLRALALCLTGTYRAVGPASVLTEDLVGAGVVHQRWADLQQQVMDQKQTLMMNVSTSLAARHSPHDLQGLGDPADLTPGQADQALRPGGVRQENTVYPPGTLFLPLSKLTPGQQEASRREAESRDEIAKLIPGLSTGRPDLSRNIMLTVTPTWQLVVPSLDGPVTLGDLTAITNLFAYPPMGGTGTSAEPPAAGTPPPPKPPLLASALAPFPRRAVLAEVTSAKKLDSLVASMQLAGLNQLWLVTFSHGADHSDLLTEALRACKGTTIAVCAVLDLLTWNNKTPEAQRDRNLFGEDSAQADAHMKRTEPDFRLTEEGWGFTLPPDQILADPTDPAVQKKLTTLVKTLAAQPGLAGLVWQGDESPGYDPLAGFQSGGDDRRLGYNAAVRLAFLRETGADPLDVAPNRDSLGIDGLLWPGGAGAYTLTDQWSKFPAGANRALLRSLYAAARAAAPTLPIFVRQRHDADIPLGWYGSWDDPRKPPPSYRSPQDQGPFGLPAGPSETPSVPPRDVQARTQSRVSLTLLSGWDYPSASELAQDIQDQTAGQHWNGFVLDFTQAPPGADADPLARLARSIAAQNALKTGHAK